MWFCWLFFVEYNLFKCLSYDAWSIFQYFLLTDTQTWQHCFTPAAHAHMGNYTCAVYSVLTRSCWLCTWTLYPLNCGHLHTGAKQLHLTHYTINTHISVSKCYIHTHHLQRQMPQQLIPRTGKLLLSPPKEVHRESSGHVIADWRLSSTSRGCGSDVMSSCNSVSSLILSQTLGGQTSCSNNEIPAPSAVQYCHP